GGDRDGNPFVTAPVTARTLIMLRRRALQLHLAQCNSLRSRLSLSMHNLEPDDPLRAALAQALFRFPRLKKRLAATHPDEHYAHWLGVIAYRLKATRRANLLSPPPDVAYASAAELAADVQLL